MIHVEVGQPWPCPPDVAEGLVATVGADEGGLSLSLVAILPKASVAEGAALRRSPAWIALTPTGPLLWIALDLGKLVLDAPWSASILPLAERPALAAAAEHTKGWAESARRSVQLYGVGGRERRVIAARAVACSAEWWGVLAGTVSAMLAEAGPRVITTADLDRLVSSETKRWPATSTEDLFQAAAAVELGGRG